MATNPIPKRPWPRFSLRTLLVVVTAVGAWLGYELSWIQQRKAVRQEWSYSEIFDDPFVDVPTTPEPQTAPGLLWLFGERGYARVWRVTAADELAPDQEAEFRRVQKLYPEAQVNWTTVR